MGKRTQGIVRSSTIQLVPESITTQLNQSVPREQLLGEGKLKTRRQIKVLELMRKEKRKQVKGQGCGVFIEVKEDIVWEKKIESCPQVLECPLFVFLTLFAYEGLLV